MKRSKNSPVKIEPELNRRNNRLRSEKNKNDHLVDERKKKKRNSDDEGSTQDIIESSQPSVILVKKIRLDNRDSEISNAALVKRNHTSREKSVRNKARVSNTLSTSDEDEKSHSSKTKGVKRLVSFSTNNKASDNYPSESQESDEELFQDEKQGFESVRVMKSEKLSADNASDQNLPNISFEHVKIEPDEIRKYKKHKTHEKVKKKKANTLLAMIRETSISPDLDDETKKINDCSVETVNEGNTRKYNKSRVSHTLSTSDEDEESHSSKTKGVKRLVSFSTNNKASDNYPSESQESDEELFQDEKQGFESVRVMKSEKLSADNASDQNLPNISFEHVKIEPDEIRKYKKHKTHEKVKKKKANTLLAMIRETSISPDLDDETKKINDCSVETVNEGNTRKYNKSRVSHTLSTSDEDEESHSSKTKGVKRLVSFSTNNKASDNYPSESQESDEELFQDEKQGFESVRVMKSEKLSADNASDQNLPNISFEHVKIEPDEIRKYKKHKTHEKVKKKKANTLLAMIRETSISPDLDDETKKINDCSVETVNEGNTRKYNKSRVSHTLSTSDEDEESHSSKTKGVKRLVSFSTNNKASDNYPSESQESDEELFQDEKQGFESVRVMKSEKLSADNASDQNLPNISFEHVKIEPDEIRKYKKHKTHEKVKKKKANTLLAMIRETSISPDLDDETKKINDCSVETVNEGNTRKYNKSRVSHTLSTSDEDEESHSSKTKGVEKLVTSSTSNKASDNYRLESQESDEELFQDESQGFEFVPVMKSEELQTDSASDNNLPNISVENVKTEPDVIRKNKKHKSKEKVKKKKANTLLAMIRDRSMSPDSDDEIKKIDDSSEESVDKGNTRKNTKSRVSQTFKQKKRDEGFSAEPDEDPLGKPWKFDLEAEARDVEEMISAIEEAEQVPDETMTIMEEGKKKTRKRLSIDDKVTIINRLTAGESTRTLAQDYGTNPSTLRKIKKNKEIIFRQHRVLKEQHGNTKRKKITNIEESAFEKAIYNWFVQQRTLGEPISRAILTEKAMIYHQTIFGAESKFRASNGWLVRFKQRHGIRNLAMQGDRLSVDSASSNEFVATFTTFLEENGYSLDQVYNADETGLSWRTLPTQTLAGGFETSAPGRKIIKDRVTVMVCANASGSHKIPLFMIGKSQKPRCFKNVENLPVIYKGQKSAWMDRDLFKEWYQEVFLPNVKKKHGSAIKCLLLLDNAPSHLPIDLLNSIDDACKIMYLPPNVTSLIQPMDQGVIAEMKKIYRKQVLRALLIEDNQVDSVSFLKKLNLTDCCTYISNAWRALTATNMHRAWNKVLGHRYVSLDVSTSCGNEELMGMLHKVPGYENLSIEEAQTWFDEDAADPGWRSLSDAEILNNMSEEMTDDRDVEEPVLEECQLDETDDDEDVSPREALAALKKLYRYVESNWECTHQNICNLSSIRAVIESDIYSRKIDGYNLAADSSSR